MSTATRAIDAVRTLSARLITRHRTGPRILQIRAWAWLAAETDDLAEKQHCPEAIVAPDPSLNWALAALVRSRHCGRLSQCWRRVASPELEKWQLELLREELRLPLLMGRETTSATVCFLPVFCREELARLAAHESSPV